MDTFVLVEHWSLSYSLYSMVQLFMKHPVPPEFVVEQYPLGSVCGPETILEAFNAT